MNGKECVERMYAVRHAGKKILRLWPLTIFLICLGISVGTYAMYGQHNLDSDISSEMVLAQLLNEEGKCFLTDSWFYSTELRVVSPVPVYQLALNLFSDWHTARTFSITVLLIGMAAAMVYMVRGVGASMKSALLWAAVAVLPLTEYNSFTLVYGGFYTVCVMLTFVEIGLVLRMGRSKGLKRAAEATALILLSLYGGLNGVRMLMICCVPLLAACAITFYLEARICEKSRKLCTLPSFPLLIGGLLCTAATLAGYAINTKVFAPAYDFMQYGETTIQMLTAEMFTDQLMNLLSFFGYRSDEVLLSLEGMVSVSAIFLVGAGVAAIILLLRMKLQAGERMTALFSLTALLSGMVVNALTLDASANLPYSVSYYMPAALLLVYSLFWLFDRFECRRPVFRTMPMLALVGIFLAGNAVYRDKDLNIYSTELEDIAWCLVDEAAYEGYATFWNANVLTEITNGELEAFSVEEWEHGAINEWLQRKDHLERKPWGRVFALLRAQDWKEGETGFDSEHLVYSSDEFYVLVYDSDEEFRTAMNW